MFTSLLYKMKNSYVSLRFDILSTFIILFVLLTLLIGLIRQIAFKDELIYTSYELMTRTSNIALKELYTGINPIEIGGIFSANIFKSGLIKDDVAKLLTYTYYLVHSVPLLQGAYWANEKGDLIYALQEKDGTITNEIILRSHLPFSHIKIYHDLKGNVIKQVSLPDDHFDPRIRPWYLAAKNSKKATWTDIYLFYPGNFLGVSLGHPVFDEQQKFLGAFGLDIKLDFLSQFLTHQSVSENGYAFIITEKENLVAYPNKKPFTDIAPLPHQLLNVHQSTHFELIDQSIDYYKKNHLSEFQLSYKGHEYLVSYQSIPTFASRGWLMGVIAPKNDFVAFLNKINLITLTFSLLALSIAILVVSNLVTRIVKPIKILVKETEKIKRFDLEGEINLTSRIQEVVDLRDAIISMKYGLKQFQRYVPKVLVRQLIESGKNISVGGVRQQLVVFFSDIEGFTTISETLDPNVLMLQICEYFEALTQIIILEKGTIDKYIGDSIMAFWGAPLPEEDASHHAAKAALDCQAKTEELNAKWAREGRPAFITRFGIHRGEAIVGNLGSSERLNYTAIGDTINIANRLEVINKNYKTHIIISDSIYKEIKERFFFRMLDSVVVKGRTKAIIIYELLGDNLSLIPFDLKAYNSEFEKGFAAYQESKWADAVIHFQQCLKIYPADTISPIFIKRSMDEA